LGCAEAVSEKETEPMPKVLISGASIAGPALAYWLLEAGYEVTIVERAPEPRPGGQAIDIRGPALDVIAAMGLGERVPALRTRMKGMTVLDIAGNEIERTTERTATGGRFDSGDIEIFRDDLAALLREVCGSRPGYLYGDSLTALETRPDGVVASFSRHPTEVFDLVLGADGLHSKVRQLAFGDEEPFLRPLGVAFAIWASPNLLDLQDWQLSFRDETAGYAIYPTRDNRELRVNIGFALTLDEERGLDLAARKALIRERAAAIGGPVPRVLETLEATEDLYFGALAQVRMPSWCKGRIALVGDAGYCPSPFTGQGTSLALIGAFVLARELARGGADHETAFAQYETRMRPFVKANQDLLFRDRAAPDADDVFNEAKMGISLEDLLG
jgi:2-polyprenyl-6-methoxyphenol hydroxylase-like FAD-dependent oxidoreductase